MNGIPGIWNRIYLNMRVLALALGGHWLSQDDYANDYNNISKDYDKQWMARLKLTTDIFHQQIEGEGERIKLANGILELGCGSGYTTAYLHRIWPDIPITAIDISSKMIDAAKQSIPNAGDAVRWSCQDMLAFLKSRETSSTSAVISSWAIGYSRPDRIIRESARILVPNGLLAVIVNRMETMPAVFETFRHIMRCYPKSVRKALWPRFPKNKEGIAAQLTRANFKITMLEEGTISIQPPETNRLDWLLKTGVLAGFDQVLPLKESGPVRDEFADALEHCQKGWEHRYIIFKAVRK